MSVPASRHHLVLRKSDVLYQCNNTIMNIGPKNISKEYEMKNNWKWALGFTLAIVILLGPLFAWRFFLPYGMMGNTNGWYMPMMYGGPAMMGFGMIFLVWLILLASLVLIGLGIVWLVKELTVPKSYGTQSSPKSN
jgi:hypothetical protein